jgi:O-6-methylguanine DNA methyltransferase
MHKALLLLRKIPKGKVTTYGELARATKSSPRAIGQVMCHNKYADTCPCYKVVRSDGSIGGYDGAVRGKKIGRKIELLRKDNIVIKNNKIDLKKYLHRF